MTNAEYLCFIYLAGVFISSVFGAEIKRHPDGTTSRQVNTADHLSAILLFTAACGTLILATTKLANWISG